MLKHKILIVINHMICLKMDEIYSTTRISLLYVSQPRFSFIFPRPSPALSSSLYLLRSFSFPSLPSFHSTSLFFLFFSHLICLLSFLPKPSSIIRINILYAHNRCKTVRNKCFNLYHSRSL